MTFSYSLIYALNAKHYGSAGAFYQPVDIIRVITKPLLFAGSELPIIRVVIKPLLFAGSELFIIRVVTKLLLFAGSELLQALVASIKLP
jgi:hypothetical protein